MCVAANQDHLNRTAATKYVNDELFKEHLFDKHTSGLKVHVKQQGTQHIVSSAAGGRTFLPVTLIRGAWPVNIDPGGYEVTSIRSGEVNTAGLKFQNPSHVPDRIKSLLQTYRVCNLTPLPAHRHRDNHCLVHVDQISSLREHVPCLDEAGRSSQGVVQAKLFQRFTRETW